MTGIYLCAFKHRISGYDIKYNDILPLPGIDYVCSCEDIDIRQFDFIIATPPCNYYSRANWRREESMIAQATKGLMPYCLHLCEYSGKPFLVENVLNQVLLPKPLLSTTYMFTYGGHTFYTNVLFDIPDKKYAVKQNKQNIARTKRNGNYNVDIVIRYFLRKVHCEGFLFDDDDDNYLHFNFDRK